MTSNKTGHSREPLGRSHNFIIIITTWRVPKLTEKAGQKECQARERERDRDELKRRILIDSSLEGKSNFCELEMRRRCLSVRLSLDANWLANWPLGGPASHLEQSSHKHHWPGQRAELRPSGVAHCFDCFELARGSFWSFWSSLAQFRLAAQRGQKGALNALFVRVDIFITWPAVGANVSPKSMIDLHCKCSSECVTLGPTDWVENLQKEPRVVAIVVRLSVSTWRTKNCKGAASSAV